MTDGQAYLKARKDSLLYFALAISLIECFICLLSISLGMRLSSDATNRKFRKKEGALFFIQVLSEKDIVVVSKPSSSSKHSGSTHESVQSFDRSST
jgi:hypothetical protein